MISIILTLFNLSEEFFIKIMSIAFKVVHEFDPYHMEGINKHNGLVFFVKAKTIVNARSLLKRDLIPDGTGWKTMGGLSNLFTRVPKT